MAMIEVHRLRNCWLLRQQNWDQTYFDNIIELIKRINLFSFVIMNTL